MHNINALVWVIFIPLVFLLSISEVSATYSIVIIQDNGFTIGSDSLEASDSGINNDACKIILIDKNLAFTLVGFEAYYNVEGKMINTFQIVANTTYNGESFEKYMNRMSERLVE